MVRPGHGHPRSDRSLTRWLTRPPGVCPLATLPTPVEPLAWLPGEVWVKRDDLSSQRYGGGKVRKLEWILANPPFDSDAPILSVGGTGSHHLLSCALHLADRGRVLHAICFPQVVDAHVRKNLAALASTSTRFWPCPSRYAVPMALLDYYGIHRPARTGTFLPAGGSTPLGCLGFVEAGLELGEQITAGVAPRPRRIYIAAGSMGSSAGLVLGLALAGVATEVRIVSAVERLFVNDASFRVMLGRVLGELRRHGLARDPGSVAALLASAGLRWRLDHDQVGEGYAIPTAAANEAVELAGRDDLALEPVYTGKCLAALLRDLDDEPGAIAGGPLLLWNTHARNDLTALIRDDWRARLPDMLRP